MSRVLVTGGTGFLGLEVVRVLRARGDEVRVLARGDSPALDELGATLIEGDVVRPGDLDGEGPGSTPRAAGARRPSLASALAGCDALVHLAGFVSRDPADGQRMMRLHVDGTRRALEAAAAAGVRRVIVASSAGTSAVSRAPVALDETAPHAHALLAGSPYHLSCIYKEEVARRLAAEHALELVIVSPALLLGPGDARGASTGDLRGVIEGQVALPPAGGTSFVDVRDAAVSMVAALTRARVGERYFLGGAMMPHAELLARVARLAGRRAPWLSAAPAFLRRAADAALRLRLSLDGATDLGALFFYCDAGKAQRELNFDPRDPLETLADTVRDLRARRA